MTPKGAVVTSIEKEGKNKNGSKVVSLNVYLYTLNIQSNFNGSNTFGTMKINSRQG